MNNVYSGKKWIVYSGKKWTVFIHEELNSVYSDEEMNSA